MDGVLVVDKPTGITSHDVVAIVRRTTGWRRVGHTGTLDPLATGVLPLVCGQATRLARFLTASDKSYRATLRFGLTTDTLDITGTILSRTDRIPTREAVTHAVDSLVGAHWQTPPAYSAKKIGGRRAYELARADQAVELAPARVIIQRATLVACEGARAEVDLQCSAGYYVRVFAQTLGEHLGTGACLEALRRTRSGDFHERAAVRLDAIRDDSAVAQRSLVPLEALLQGWPSVQLTAAERARVSHGQAVSLVPGHAFEGTALAWPATGEPATGEQWVRLLDEEGRLVAMAVRDADAGTLRPTVVLI